MTLSEFERRWLDVTCNVGTLTVKRVNNIHVLDLYVGFDSQGRNVFILVSSKNPKLGVNSKSIVVSTTKRADESYVSSFILIDSSQQTVFFRLCYDLFEFTSRAENEMLGIKMLKKRFRVWQRLLQKGADNLLPNSVIKGLIGELLFMKDFCFTKYGVEQTINAWIGAHSADKDYVFSDTWYEIKSLDTSSSSVGISSLEQLDCGNNGYLVLMYLNKTSIEDTQRVSLFSLVNKIREIIADDYESMVSFEGALIEVGYLHLIEYDNYAYQFCGSKKYMVDKEFPKITREALPRSIINAKYSLDIASIEEWSY